VGQIHYYNTQVPCPRRFCLALSNSRIHSQFHQLAQNSALSFELVGLGAVRTKGHVEVWAIVYSGC